MIAVEQLPRALVAFTEGLALDRFGALIRASLAFLAMTLATLLIVTSVPAVSLTLPRLIHS